MPCAEMCDKCNFYYMKRTPYNYPEETRCWRTGCALFHIIDPAIRLNKHLDIKKDYCPIINELENDDVSDDFKKKVFRDTVLRMYRQGFPSLKNLDPYMISNVIENHRISNDLSAARVYCGLNARKFKEFHKNYTEEENEE